MLRSLGLLLLVFVVAEMAALIALGRAIGLLPTILVVLGAGFVGAWIARWQGARAAFRARSQLASGVMPTSEVVDGMLIAAAAVMLMLPGVISDVIGLALLFPPTRALIRRQAAASFAKRSALGRFMAAARQQRDVELGMPPGDQIIDARVIETRVVDE